MSPHSAAFSEALGELAPVRCRPVSAQAVLPPVPSLPPRPVLPMLRPLCASAAPMAPSPSPSLLPRTNIEHHSLSQTIATSHCLPSPHNKERARAFAVRAMANDSTETESSMAPPYLEVEVVARPFRSVFGGVAHGSCPP